MIIIHVMGGLGNQLCQYALYEKFKYLGKNVNWICMTIILQVRTRSGGS
jgi:hypothetical protein